MARPYPECSRITKRLGRKIGNVDPGNRVSLDNLSDLAADGACIGKDIIAHALAELEDAAHMEQLGVKRGEGSRARAKYLNKLASELRREQTKRR
jgi:hypothetical protein